MLASWLAHLNLGLVSARRSASPPAGAQSPRAKSSRLQGLLVSAPEPGRQRERRLSRRGHHRFPLDAPREGSASLFAEIQRNAQRCRTGLDHRGVLQPLGNAGMGSGLTLKHDGLVHVWCHRPPFWLLALFFVAYMLGCGFAEALRIVPGISVSIWPPGGVFIATLLLAPFYSWPWWMLAGCLAEMLAQLVWFHSPLPAGFLIYVGNALGAAVGATLLIKICGRPVRLETLRDVLSFVALGAGVAPLVSATVGSAILAWFSIQSQSFTAVWPMFWIGDATGILLVAPLALVLIQHWRTTTKLSVAQWLEAGILGLVFLGVAALSLSSHYLPFAYIIMPPLLWAAVRFEFKGVAVALSLLALITMALTLSGASQFVTDPQSQREKQVMLQLFLVISALSALIVAAISRQHQHALTALRENERQLQQMIDAVPAMIWSATPRGKPAFVNKRFADVTGTTLEDNTATDGSLSLCTIHPDDRAEAGKVLAESFKTGIPCVRRYRQLRRDGSYRWSEVRAEPLRNASGEVLQWYGVTFDIDDEVRAEEALRRSERRLRQFLDAVPIHCWSATPDGLPSYINKRARDYMGIEIADFEPLHDPRNGKKLQDAIFQTHHPEDAAEIQRRRKQTYNSGEKDLTRFRRRGRDGIYRWMETRLEPLRDQDGTIVQWYGVSLDIDEAMRAQEALRRSERQLQELIDAVPAVIWCTTPEGIPRYLNKRGKDVTGLTVKDLIAADGSRSLTVVHPDDRQTFDQALARSLKTGTSFVGRYRQRRANGPHRWVESRAEPMYDDTGKVLQWYGVTVDIDDQMRAEEALRRAQDKLAHASQAASLSELSASIAHEVNQPLAAIVATSHACSRWLSADPPNLERAKNTLERIIRDANSASEVVSRIRALFNQLGKTRLPADITEVIAGVGRLMADELALNKIQLEYEFAPSLPSALIDPVQIEQVLINLIRNAVDALDGSTDGMRRIRLRAFLDSDTTVRVEVQDQGAGMKEPEQAFEPFFTTKKDGMGMGLAICRSIIESHNGRLWATSNQPNGTTLAFTLPIQARGAA